MIFGDGWGLSFPDIYLPVEENLQKKPQPGKLTWLGIEPEPARWKAPLDHSGSLPDCFHSFSGSVRPRIVLKEGHPISSCFPLGLERILYFSQRNVVIIFCIDGPAFLKKIKMDNSLPIPKECRQYFSSWDCRPLFLLHSLSPLSEGFTPFDHSSSGETCFSKRIFKPV